MKSFQGKERDEKLEQLYKNLQQDWDSFKQCNPTTSRRYSTDSNIAIEKAIQLVDNSPRSLMSKLQQQSSSPLEAWNLRTTDLAVQEIILERRAAIESGKLKGRRLFYPTEGESEIGNGLNTDMGQDNEVRSLSYYYSEDEREDETYESKGLPDSTRCSYSSSSSSFPCLSGASVDKDEEVEEAEDICNIVGMVTETRVDDGRRGNGGRYIVFLGVVAIALLVLAIYMRSARSFEGYEVILVPT